MMMMDGLLQAKTQSSQDLKTTMVLPPVTFYLTKPLAEIWSF